MGASPGADALCRRRTGPLMNAKLVNEIVNAVLYEGYILYPYRPSSVKNRQRFNFGVFAPRDYCEKHASGETYFLQSECLVRGSPGAELIVNLRFLHVAARIVNRLTTPVTDLSEANRWNLQPVDSLDVDGRICQTRQEAVERDVCLRFPLEKLISSPMQERFLFPAEEEIEPIRDATGTIAGAIARHQEMISGEIEISADQPADGLYKIAMRISNLTPVQNAEAQNREDAVTRSFVSAHLILQTVGGEFISLMDPPAEFQEIAATCHNVGTWPVLVGEQTQHDAMLASPIILYDYPQIAPESAGDFFDGTEMDEMLALRVMTLTDLEKQEMRQGDDRARQILERTENLPEEQFLKLHGALRGLRSLSTEVK